MSQKDLQKFLEAVRQDPSLQEKLQAEGADPVALAKKAALTITAAEWREGAGVTILSNEQLKGVAGGRSSMATQARLYQRRRWEQERNDS